MIDVSLSNVFNPDKTPNMIDWLGRAWAVPTNQSNSNSKAKSSTVRSGPVQPSLIQTSQSVSLSKTQSRDAALSPPQTFGPSDSFGVRLFVVLREQLRALPGQDRMSAAAGQEPEADASEPPTAPTCSGDVV